MPPGSGTRTSTWLRPHRDGESTFDTIRRTAGVRPFSTTRALPDRGVRRGHQAAEPADAVERTGPCPRAAPPVLRSSMRSMMRRTHIPPASMLRL